MVKVLQIVAVGLSTTLLATLVGCSQASDRAEAPATSEETTEESIASDSESDNVSAQAPVANDAANDSEESYRTVENITLPAPSNDPLAMVVGLRQFSGEPIGSEQIKVNYPAPDQAVVVTTVRGLPDDSVNAIRTRYEFEPVAEQPGQWQIVKVTQQNKCQSGRGSEDWTAELCQ